MLSRGNSESAIRLRRSKSTSSVPKTTRVIAHPISSDLDSTFRNAKVAANRAFDAAYGLPADYARTGRQGMTGRKGRSEGQGAHLARKRSMLENGVAAPQNPKQRKSRNSLQSQGVQPHTGIHVRGHAIERQEQLNRPLDDQSSVTAQEPEAMASAHTRKWEMMEPADMSEPFQHSGYMSAQDKSESPSQTKAFVQSHTTGATSDELALGSVAGPEGQGKLEQLRSLMSASFPPRYAKDGSYGIRTTNTSAQPTASADDDESGLTRKFSTLKRKLSRLPASLKGSYRRHGSRTMSMQVGDVPAQQVRAQRSHYFSLSQTTKPGVNGPVEEADTSKIDGIKMEPQPPTPPPHSTRPCDLPRTHFAEETLIGDVDGTSHIGSRLTSWTNSSGRNTVVLRVPSSRMTEDEQLNIHEHDRLRQTKKPTSVMKRLRIPRSKSSTSFDEPSEDSQRMYSALVRRIGGTGLRTDSRLPSTGEADHRHRHIDDLNLSRSTAETYEDTGRASKSTIRLVHDDSSDDSQDPNAMTLVSDCLRLPINVRRELMSPSLYSFRPYHTDSKAQMSNISLPERVLTPTGVAMVSDSQPFATWSLEVSSGDGERLTSGEWRDWTSQAVAGFDTTAQHQTVFTPSAEEINGSEEVPEQPRNSIKHGTTHWRDDYRVRQGIARNAPSLRERLARRRGSNPSQRSALPVSLITKDDDGRVVSQNEDLSELQQDLAQLSLRLRQQKRGEQSLQDHSFIAQSEEETSVLISRGNATHQLDDVKAPDAHATTARPNPSSTRTTPSKSAPQRRRSERGMRRQRIMQQPAALNESFLHNIRRGPYTTSPGLSPAKTTTTIENVNATTTTPPRFAKTDENSAPSSGQRMADLFLKARMKEQVLGERSPSAFL